MRVRVRGRGRGRGVRVRGRGVREGRGRGRRRGRGGRGQAPLDLLLLLQRADERCLQPRRVLRLKRPLNIPADTEFTEPARGRRRGRGREGGVVSARAPRAPAAPALPAPHGREVAAALRAYCRHRRPRHTVFISKIVDDMFQADQVDEVGVAGRRDEVHFWWRGFGRGDLQ